MYPCPLNSLFFGRQNLVRYIFPKIIFFYFKQNDTISNTDLMPAFHRPFFSFRQVPFIFFWLLLILLPIFQPSNDLPFISVWPWLSTFTPTFCRGLLIGWSIVTSFHAASTEPSYRTVLTGILKVNCKNLLALPSTLKREPELMQTLFLYL